VGFERSNSVLMPNKEKKNTKVIIEAKLIHFFQEKLWWDSINQHKI